MGTLSIAAPAPTSRRTRAANFAWAVVAYNILVILWGALVRATGSGAGCGNHWPLCNGQVVPLAPGLHTIIEFTHRMMVGGSTFAMLALLLFTFRATRPADLARKAVVAATVLLLNEAFLGALLVKLGYVTGNASVGRVVILAIHFSNTLLLLAALTATAWLLARPERLLTRPEFLPAHQAGWTAVGALIATLLVGVTGSMAALGDTLFPAPSLSAAIAQDFAAASPWLLRVRWIHPASALLAALFLVGLVRRRRLSFTARIVLGLLAFQFAMGMADILLLAPAWMQMIHLLGADLYWVSLVVLALETIAGDSVSQDGQVRTIRETR